MCGCSAGTSGSGACSSYWPLRPVYEPIELYFSPGQTGVDLNPLVPHESLLAVIVACGGSVLVRASVVHSHGVNLVDCSAAVAFKPNPRSLACYHPSHSPY